MLAGDPGAAEKSKVRHQCDPQGPVRYVLESLHTQAASLTKQYEIVAHSQLLIKVKQMAPDQVADFIREMRKRNRTLKAMNSKEEATNLRDIYIETNRINNGDMTEPQ